MRSLADSNFLSCCCALCCRAELIDRFVQGLSALFLAVRRRPVIRYQRNSEQASRLADSLYALTYKQVHTWHWCHVMALHQQCQCCSNESECSSHLQLLSDNCLLSCVRSNTSCLTLGRAAVPLSSSSTGEMTL
jgi:hypothetical protein